MPGTIEAMAAALSVLFTWPTLGFLVVGTLVGLVFGVLPGLNGPIALALLMPVSFSMARTDAIVLFGAAMGGVTFGGSVSAILINTPGTAPNAATCFDGYPLARQGRANEALGVSATASALGAIFGLAILVLILPVAREIILAFQPPEFFWLGVFGLTILAIVSQGNFLKGLVSGALGLLFSFVGYSNLTGVYRFGFGTQYLWDGVDLVVALIGIFAVAEMLKLSKENRTIARSDIVTEKGGMLRGVMDVLTHPLLFLRSAAVGTLIGIVPGAGGTVATFIAYMQAVQTSDDPDSFGHGNVEGIIASEAANDAKDGGALLPTVVFGIPGSAVMAVLLGGFILHGVQPGRALLNENLPLLFTLIFALLFANILTSAIGLGTANGLAKLTRVPVRLLTPAILVTVFVGAFALRNNLGDVLMVLVFGLFGYAMMAFGYSRVALVLGLVLGPIVEKAFVQSMQIANGSPVIFFTRPISLALFVLTVLSLAVPIINGARRDASRGEDG